MSLRHSVEYGALVATGVVVKAAPRRLALRIGAGIGWLGWALRLRRSVVLENLALALPEASAAERKRIASRAAGNFGRTCTEFLRFGGRDRRRIHELVTIRGDDELRAVLAEGRGAVVVTGHLGAWALYVAAVSMAGIPTALLVGRQSNPKVDRLILALPGKHVTLISHGKSAPRGLLQNLRLGRAIFMVADQHGGPRGTIAPFFGRDASTLSLPGAIVARQEVPLFIMAGHREREGLHELSFRRIPLTAAADRGEEAMRTEIATICNQAIADAVLEHPDQYFWYHRRYREPRVADEPLSA